MAGKDTPSYADAWDEARGLLGRARLADPGEHFPYKHDEVLALLQENPPAGPGGENDDSRRVSDFMSTRIADATKAYVEAQAAYLKNAGDATLADYQEAADDLSAARRAHRRKRAGAMIVSGTGA